MSNREQLNTEKCAKFKIANPLENCFVLLRVWRRNVEWRNGIVTLARGIQIIAEHLEFSKQVLQSYNGML